MKKLILIYLLSALIFLLLACTETPNPSDSLFSSTSSIYTLPEKCNNGHTFPNEARNCTECGIDYYAATLTFKLSEDGTYYRVQGLGECERKVVIVPETYNGLPVKEIRTLVKVNTIMGNHQDVTHVVLPETIEVISRGAFQGYKSLISINLPDGITRIEEETFSKCKSLENLILPAGLTYIDENAFMECVKLVMEIPDSVTYLGEKAFAGLERMEELWIPEEMTEIPYGLARFCFSLTKVTYGNNITKIGDYAFEECISLRSFTIGEGVTEIGQHAFDGCTGLTTITIPDNVEKIGRFAFTDCENLETIVLGAGIKVLGKPLTDGCTKLKAVYYCGTKDQWSKISVDSFTSHPLDRYDVFARKDVVYFYSEEPPTEPGNYWRYVDGVPTPWET